MTERMQGRIVNVWTTPAATTLKASAAIGATVLSVDDASILNDDGDGGSLLIGSQVTTYTAVDDDAGTVTIPAPGLTAAADADDPVFVWSELYGMVDDRQWAAVEPAGKGDRADHIDAIVDDSVELTDGDRGKRGEACTLVRESGSDTWVVKRVFGRPRKARGMKAEAHDAYTLTAADKTAGTATIPLSHAPIDESVKLTFGTVPQEPSNYTVNYDAATITFPLAGWESAGRRFSMHYWYVRGPVKVPVPAAPVVIGSTTAEGSSGTLSLALPAGWQSGDLFVLAANFEAAVPASSSDTRIQGTVSTAAQGVKVFWGHLTASTSPIVVTGQAFRDAGVLSVYRDVTVSGSAVGTVPGRPIPAPQVASSGAVVVSVMTENAPVAGTAVTESGSSNYTRRANVAYGGRIAANFDRTATEVNNPASNFTMDGTDDIMYAVTLRLVTP